MSGWRVACPIAKGLATPGPPCGRGMVRTESQEWKLTVIVSDGVSRYPALQKPNCGILGLIFMALQSLKRRWLLCRRGRIRGRIGVQRQIKAACMQALR